MSWSGRSSLNLLLWQRFSCHRKDHITDCITRNRLLDFLSWVRSGKIESFTMHIVNACLEISKLLKTLKSAVILTGFKIQHCTMIKLASSSPVFNLPSLQKVVWMGLPAKPNTCHPLIFGLPPFRLQGWLLEGKQNIIFCGQWSPWGSERKPDVCPDVDSKSRGVQQVKLFVFALQLEPFFHKSPV